MRKLLYPRLAAQNIRKNKSTYFPYILSCITMIALFFSLVSIRDMVSDGSFYGIEQIGQILETCTPIAAIFTAIILFYTNSFVMKRRKKELGLYSILGMEKRHIARVLFFEVLYSGGISLLFGLLAGALFSRLMFLVLLKMVGLQVGISLAFSWHALGLTAALFTGAFLLTMVFNLLQIHAASPIALMQGSRQGEKEPKTKWLLAILGTLCLAGGYTMALMAETPVEALNLFFFAVLLVIIGTYALFTAGSIALFKLLRKKKAFYYNPRNFISVSGMIYRMKQNAAGLASICILSTAVLVVLSATVSLYLGEEDIIHNRYPREVAARVVNNEAAQDTVLSAVDNLARKHGVALQNQVYYRSFFTATIKDGQTFLTESDGAGFSIRDYYEVYLIPLEDYNRQYTLDKTLEPGEVLLCSDTSFEGDTLTFAGNTYRIREKIEGTELTGKQQVTHAVNIILPSMQELESVLQNLPSTNTRPLQTYFDYSFDLQGDEYNTDQFLLYLTDTLKATDCKVETVKNVYEARDSFLSLYGTLFFIGIFFGLLFMIATVLIIYYKQVSEGYDDRERYQIMQKVGLSKQEIKKTIHKQVLMVFFLPLVTAVVHSLVAFPCLSKVFVTMGLTNTTLYLICLAGTVLVFAAAYAIVYSLTAKTYYRLVERKVS